MSAHDSECYNRIRFTMDDTDGSLRFRRLDIQGGPSCSDTLVRLEAYLKARPLRDVDLEEVRQVTADCDPSCGKELVRVIAEQKTFFCADVDTSNRVIT